MRVITQEQIEALIEQARQSERGRVPFRLHENEELVQRMVNAIIPASYVTPHKHQDPDKTETCCVLVGKIACVRFSDSGDVEVVHILDANGPTRIVDIRPGIYHTFIALEPSAMLEIIQGPYDASSHKKFASWAPAEGTPEAAMYLEHLTALVREYD